MITKKFDSLLNGGTETVRDYQRTKVYRWEDQQWWMCKRGDMTVPEVKEFVIARLGIKTIRVKDGRGRRNAGGCHIRRTIWMPRWSRTPAVICHEVAHCLTDDKHGPKFVTKYCELLERCGLIPSAQVARMTAIDCGVDVN